MIKLDHFFGKNFLFMLAMKFPKRRHTKHASNLYFLYQTEKNQTLGPHFTNFNEFCSNVELCGRLQLSLDVFNGFKEVSELRMKNI